MIITLRGRIEQMVNIAFIYNFNLISLKLVGFEASIGRNIFIPFL